MLDNGLSVEAVKEALTTCKGDMLLASQVLSCRLKELADAVELVPELQAHFNLVEQTKQKVGDYRTLSDAAFARIIARNAGVYKITAMEELHKLATMEIGESAEMAKVKRAACVDLLGSGPRADSDTDLSAALLELARKYAESAPRIKSLRVQFSIESGAVAEGEPVSLEDIPATTSRAELPFASKQGEGLEPAVPSQSLDSSSSRRIEPSHAAAGSLTLGATKGDEPTGNA